MKRTKILLLTLLTIAFTACSNDDDTPSPSISYESNTYEVTFYTEGNTEVPAIQDLNGDVTYSFDPVVISTEYAIDPASGVVSWEKSLPLDNTELTVVATDADGLQASTQITLSNNLGSSTETFVGTYHTADTNDITVDFNPAPDFDITNGLLSIDDTESFSWERTGNTVTIIFTDLGDGLEYIFTGDINGYNNATVPIIAGTYTIDDVEDAVNYTFSIEHGATP